MAELTAWELDSRINTVNKNIHAVQAEVAAVGAAVLKTDKHIDTVEKQLADLKKDVDVLQSTLYGLIEQSEKQHNIQVAEERIVKIRQELERQYGNYEKIRKTMVGILQTVDLGIVKRETVNFVSDEFMLTTPNYWLAPCLVAMSAWVNNKKEIAETAVKEALRRNEENTCLMFALVCRRAGRKNACYQWALRYLSVQNPENLDMKCIFVLDAFANGLLGSDSEGSVFKYMNEWVEKLSEQGDFEQRQIENWSRIVKGLKKASDFECRLDAVRKRCNNPALITEKIELACLHKNIYDYVDGVMSVKINSQRVEDKLDEVLMDMVKDFDDDEREARYEERLNDFIIKYDGDKDRAENDARIERSEFEAERDFTEILSEAAMGVKSKFTSDSTKKFSLAFCKGWLKNAYMDVVAKGRMDTSRPLSFVLEDDFDFNTADGRNVGIIIDGLKEDLEKKKTSEIQALNVMLEETERSAKNKIIGGCITAGICALLGLGGLGLFWVGAIVGAIIAISGFVAKKNARPEYEYSLKDIEKKYQVKFDDASEEIRRICAEMVRFDKALTEKNRDETAAVKLLDSLSPEMYIRRYDSDKNVKVLV